MFSTRRINHNQISSRISLAEMFPGARFSNIEEMQYRLRNYFRRNRQEREDEEALIEEEYNSNLNKNFMKEKDINFRLYPFYINWKKLEENEYDYFHTLIHFGYFGASIYSLFKDKFPILAVKNIIYILSTFIPDYLLRKDSKEEAYQKEIKDFFEKLPYLDDLFLLIKNKIMMIKEVPMIIIVLKIYEIYFLIQKKYKEIEKALKSEFLLLNYLNDNEYNEIFKNHFKGKVNKIFIKIADDYGKEYGLPKTKVKFYNHIKYIYKKYIKKE